jgi:hypothetical protein
MGKTGKSRLQEITIREEKTGINQREPCGGFQDKRINGIRQAERRKEFNFLYPF